MSITKLQEVFFFKWRWQVLSFQPNTWELGLICFQRLHWLTKIDWNGFVFIGMHKRLVLRMADMVYFLHVGNGYASHHVLSEKMFLIFEPVSDLDWKQINIVVRKYWMSICIFGKYVDSQTSACTNCVVQYLSVDPLQFGFGGRCSTLFRETLDPKISGNQINYYFINYQNLYFI